MTKVKRTSNAPEVGQGDKALKEFLSRSFDESVPMSVSGDNDALNVLLFAVSTAHEQNITTTHGQVKTLEKWAEKIKEAMKDNTFEGQQI